MCPHFLHISVLDARLSRILIPINYITSPCIASIDGANIIASRLAAPPGQHKYRRPPLLSWLSTGERWDRPHAPYQHAVHAPCSESRGSCAGGTHPSSSVLTWSSWARCGSSFASAASPLRAPAFMSARAGGIFDRVERVFEVGRGRVNRDFFAAVGNRFDCDSSAVETTTRRSS